MNYNKYSYDEAISLNKDGLSIMEICRITNIPKTNLQKYFSYHKINSNQKHFCKYNKAEIIKLNNGGFTVGEISKKLDAGCHSIYSVIYRNGDIPNKNKEYGYNYDEIKKLAEEGFTVKEISEKIGINKKHLYVLSSNGKFDIIKENDRKYEEIVKASDKNKTIREISNETGFAHEKIYTYFRRHNIKFKEDNGLLTGYSLFPMNEYKAYFLGIVFGDGSLGKPTDPCIEIGMNDLDVLDSINKNMFDDKINISQKRLPSGKMHYRLSIYNSCIWKEAVEHFKLCNKKSAVIEFPELLEEKYLPHFVRGLIDSDGCFILRNDKKLSFTYGSCSYKFIKKLLNVLIKYCGINEVAISKIITNAGSDFFLFKACNKKDPFAIGKWAYENSENNRGERKYNIWLKSYNEKINKEKAIKNNLGDQ